MEQINLFECLYDTYKITKPIRLIEFFAGYGSQALSLKNLGANFQHYKICEWAIPSIIAYADLHRNELSEYGNDYCSDLTKEQIASELYSMGVSIDYNKPATLDQLKRMKEDKLRLCFNSIMWTNNLVDISRVKGKDLHIEDKENFTYLLTYSFPCQDLSLAGKLLGLSKGERSTLLWQVERILNECEHKPDVLVMENVPMVHGLGNDEYFKEFQLRLEKLGYQNYWEDLSATEFGIPQTRNRTFMVSILGNYNYTFPKKRKLKLCLRDLLEDNEKVDKKYYLTIQQIQQIQQWNSFRNPINEAMNVDDTCFCITAKSNTSMNASMLLIKNATKKGYLEAELGDGVDISSRMETHRGTVQKGKAQTLTTQGGQNVGVVVNIPNDIDKVKVLGNYSPSQHESSRIVSSSSYPTVKENHGTIPAIDESELLGGIGEKDSNKGTQWKNQNRIYSSSSSSPTIATSFNPYYEYKQTIRKLTPKECYRLMGLKDTDIALISEHQTDASNYHLAGDSIVTTCLMAIFGEMLDINWYDKFNEKGWWNNE